VRRVLIASWAIALGYWLARATVFSVPDYCPDKIWEARPADCDWSALDVALFATLPLLMIATLVVATVGLIRRLRARRQRPLL
jgi:hypothetical protein